MKPMNQYVSAPTKRVPQSEPVENAEKSKKLIQTRPLPPRNDPIVITDDGVLVIRAKKSFQRFFIEFPFSKSCSFKTLKSIITAELGEEDDQFLIIKVPDTIVRSDWDIGRFDKETELFTYRGEEYDLYENVNTKA
eukprot:TRINITY_DN1311_c1_g1_i1.p1 TRINITY_DN1311_c1_g1~~TRINITY_DN1311_c1_g1_i1.p1  ORF type:complete len:136 (-),score=35.35 TRINITY_DN1311_c1_g1_i1:15-422(-)